MPEVNISVPVPEGTKSRFVVCDIKKNHLKVGLKGQPPIIDVSSYNDKFHLLWERNASFKSNAVLQCILWVLTSIVSYFLIRVSSISQLRLMTASGVLVSLLYIEHACILFSPKPRTNRSMVLLTITSCRGWKIAEYIAYKAQPNGVVEVSDKGRP